MSIRGMKVKKIENEQLMALNKWETGIVEKENNGTNLHSFESIPI